MSSFFRRLWGAQPKQQTAAVSQTRPEVSGFTPISQLSTAGHDISLSNEATGTTAAKRKADSDLSNAYDKKPKLDISSGQTDPLLAATISSTASVVTNRKRKNSATDPETFPVKKARLQAAERDPAIASIKRSSPCRSLSPPAASIIDEQQPDQRLPSNLSPRSASFLDGSSSRLLTHADPERIVRYSSAAIRKARTYIRLKAEADEEPGRRNFPNGIVSGIGLWRGAEVMSGRQPSITEGEGTSVYRSRLASAGNVAGVVSGHLEQRPGPNESVERLGLPPLFNISRQKPAILRQSKLPKLTVRKQVGQSKHRQRALGGVWNQSGGWLPMGPSQWTQ